MEYLDGEKERMIAAGISPCYRATKDYVRHCDICLENFRKYENRKRTNL
jgi:hypothetical protein